jgi:saccharopine dehydrogenase (NAD+, L-lysine-forming)
MKVAIIGGAGAMARTTILDLLDNQEVDHILIADYQAEKAKQIADSLNDSRVESAFVNGFDVDSTVRTIEEYDCVINSAQLFPNLFERIMDACLKAGCHYNDLGGMYWTTKKLLKRSDEFKNAGLTAILCIGSAPGITNILGRYACDLLDEVESVHFWDASVDLTDMKGIDVFAPPYSIRTIMQEYSDEPVQYIDGEFKILSPFSGGAEMDFPEPIGKRTCIHTLHSEPATFVPAFESKGLRNCTWRLGLPSEFHNKAKFFGEIGFGYNKPIKVNDVEIIPREVLAAVVERHVDEKFEDVDLEINDMECLRAQVTGRRDGKKFEYNVDCIAKPHSRWGGSCGDLCTGTPPSIAAGMQAMGVIKNPGVWGPEIIDPELFFAELGKREMKVEVTLKKDLTLKLEK